MIGFILHDLRRRCHAAPSGHAAAAAGLAGWWRCCGEATRFAELLYRCWEGLICSKHAIVKEALDRPTQPAHGIMLAAAAPDDAAGTAPRAAAAASDDEGSELSEGALDEMQSFAGDLDLGGDDSDSDGEGLSWPTTAAAPDSDEDPATDAGSGAPQEAAPPVALASPSSGWGEAGRIPRALQPEVEMRSRKTTGTRTAT